MRPARIFRPSEDAIRADIIRPIFCSFVVGAARPNTLFTDGDKSHAPASSIGTCTCTDDLLMIALSLFASSTALPARSGESRQQPSPSSAELSYRHYCDCHRILLRRTPAYHQMLKHDIDPTSRELQSCPATKSRVLHAFVPPSTYPHQHSPCAAMDGMSMADDNVPR